MTSVNIEPISAPKDVKVDRIHPTVMVVFWTPLTLSEARGFITSYTVFYSPQVSRTKRQESNTLQQTVSGNANRTTIYDLDPNTAYNVQMSANTKAGASALSEVISSSVSPDTGIVLQLVLWFIIIISTLWISLDRVHTCIRPIIIFLSKRYKSLFYYNLELILISGVSLTLLIIAQIIVFIIGYRR